jgi:two-component system, chemotaxis family, sensor kinase CheA
MESEYKEMFQAEAQEGHEELNVLLTTLEKDRTHKGTMDAIFRVTHTLKGNAMGVGADGIASLSHVLEDLFAEARAGKLVLDDAAFGMLFKANDKLGELIQALSTGENVAYRGVQTKLQVYLRAACSTKEAAAPASASTTAGSPLPVPQQAEPEASVEVEDDPSENKMVFSEMVQIPVRKLDDLMNLVGQLVIERDTLIAHQQIQGGSNNHYARLLRITSDIQYSVMDVRLVQIGSVFSKFHRVVRDAASTEGKKVDLVLEGTEIEIDRNILKIISDSLIHLVRNAVGHGIEAPEVRKSKGKSEAGRVALAARNEKDNVVLEISDDGAGMDVERIRAKAVAKGFVTAEAAAAMEREDVLDIIFMPGFSGAEKVTDISGRGVGMEVVRKATDSVGGKVSISTQEGQGSTVTLLLPSSLVVKGALLFELDHQEYAIPLVHVEAVVALDPDQLHRVNSGYVASCLGRTTSILFLSEVLALGMFTLPTKSELHNERTSQMDKLQVVVVSYHDKRFGLVVDKLLQQKEIVEKALAKPIHELELFTGATILGSGDVCLVLDVARIAQKSFKMKQG